MEITISASSSLHFHLHKNPIFLHSSSAPSILSYPPTSLRLHRFCALKISPDGGRVGTSSSSSSGGQDVTGNRANLLRKPVISPEGDAGVEEASWKEIDNEDDGRRREEDGWVDWEDQILEDTVPLVGFVRMILHSGKHIMRTSHKMENATS